MRDTIATLSRIPRAAIAATVLMLACALGGCASGGAVNDSFAMASSGGTATVAFESIDGPPETLFRKLVTQLAQEANARQIAMVSRESPAQFRIRGYVAAHVQGKKTTITWVWDVYDADRESRQYDPRICRTHRRQPAGHEIARDADHVLIDGLPVRPFPVEQTALVDGDALSFSIAAASVFAKPSRHFRNSPEPRRAAVLFSNRAGRCERTRATLPVSAPRVLRSPS